jgi:hypothetical protein
MSFEFLLFDMDGVLLEPGGYHQSLRASVKRNGVLLGAPHTDLTEDEIAKFEALNITNEWDSVAICAALTLLHIWKIDPNIRLNSMQLTGQPVTLESPNFDSFLTKLLDGGHLPGETSYQFICNENSWLDPDQREHLWSILANCRDIYQSPTLPAHQETVLGSHTFHVHYKLTPKLNTESYLLKYDRPIMTDGQFIALNKWRENPNHIAGILTNRPSSTPSEYLSAPEAELGIELIGLQDLPYIGSGILGWYAVNHCQLPAHQFLKPNPVHTLTLLQRCLGNPLRESLASAVALWKKQGSRTDWEKLDQSRIVVFEDSIKGLISAKTACELLKDQGLNVELILIGVSNNTSKREVLRKVTPNLISNIKEIDWQAISSWYDLFVI